MNVMRSSKGFTLIEVIIGLLAFSILGIMLTTALSSYTTRAIGPITDLRSTMALYSTMEKITLDYDVDMDLDLNALQSKIGSEGTTQNNIYGHYTVINNNYYDCDAASSQTFTTGGNKLLVTIGAPDNNAINVTNLFIQQ